MDPLLTAAVWYPCVGKPAQVEIGFDYSTAVQDCPLTGEKLPLIVISHGVGGWSGNYHALAEMLADAGFVVAAINHPRDSGQSKTRDPNDIASMTQRPVDMTRPIDFMLDRWSDASQIDPARIGVFGFSRGGFTGLAMIGGNPDWKLLLDNCPTYPGNRFCEQIRSSGNRSFGSVIHGSKPLYWSTLRAVAYSPPKAWAKYRFQSSYGHPNMVETAYRPKMLQWLRITCPPSQTIALCQTLAISLFFHLAARNLRNS